ncbi:Rpn family recombination-promoting nuclease/putative transposase [Rickettsia rickettsii]|nr:Rpn family recombination-promoting nuclease/putative transposase [Rickettsia rickettsii]USD86062.1 Rpn family recombination-promoting nuclease/putative transposase [Rickettsia rickettsii]WGQ96117.1 PD-(D/E)XK nuclease family transposase [Rickettsia rickettsii str. 'Sheila Smith']
MEMHKRNESDYLKRVQYYSAHSYVQQLTQGIKHKDLLPVIVISLIKTKMLETKTNIYLIFPMLFIELKILIKISLKLL